MHLPHLSWLVLTPVYFTTSNLGNHPSLEGMRGPEAQLAEPPLSKPGNMSLPGFQTAEGQSEEEGN